MKIPTIRLLPVLFVVIALGVSSAKAGPAIASDTLNVFAVPPGSAPILIATGSESESDEFAEVNHVQFVMTLGPNPIAIGGNPTQYNHATALLDSDGSISDIFGVWRSGTEGNFIYSLAFISDPDPSILTLNNDTFSGFGAITNQHPEDRDSYDATIYLATGIGAVPYTATFTSDREVPDSGTTFSLLGMAATGLAFLRRKLS